MRTLTPQEIAANQQRERDIANGQREVQGNQAILQILQNANANSVNNGRGVTVEAIQQAVAQLRTQASLPGNQQATIAQNMIDRLQPLLRSGGVGAAYGRGILQQLINEQQERTQRTQESFRLFQQGAPTSLADRERLAQQLAEAQDRVVQAQRAQAAANAELRRQEVERLQNYRSMVEQARRLAEQAAEQHRLEVRQSRFSFSTMDQEQQARALRIAEELNRAQTEGVTANLSIEDRQFASGLPILRDLLDTDAERVAQNNPLIQRLLELSGANQRQQQLDADAAARRQLEVEVRSQIEVALVANAQETAREITEALTPEITRQAMEVGREMAIAVQRQLLEGILEGFRAQQNATAAAQTGQ